MDVRHSRRRFLTGAAAAPAAALLSSLRSHEAHAQAHAALPMPFGPGDQRGAVRRITPQKVLEAMRLVKEGRVIDFGRVYERGMPLFGNRVFSLTIPTPGGPAGETQTIWHDEMFVGQIGQIGTQLDGLGHIGMGDGFYGGHKLSDLHDPAGAGGMSGLRKLGIENCGPIVTRGVLIDVAGHKGVKQLGPQYEITAADLMGALQRARLELRPGDAAYLHTGWGSLWMKDNDAFGKTEPGIGLEAARFLIAKEIALVGSDSWGTEVFPNPNPRQAFPVHQELITKNGIYNHENLATEVLVEAGVREFLMMFTPLKLHGATGSPGAPIAVV